MEGKGFPPQNDILSVLNKVNNTFLPNFDFLIGFVIRGTIWNNDKYNDDNNGNDDDNENII